MTILRNTKWWTFYFREVDNGNGGRGGGCYIAYGERDEITMRGGKGQGGLVAMSGKNSYK